jgi:hypothetical protein
MAIMMPKKEPSAFSKLIVPAATLGGAAIGSVVPGAGTAAGAALGASLGGAAGAVTKGVVEKDPAQVVAGAAQGLPAGVSLGDAMTRRLQRASSMQKINSWETE